MMVETGMYRTNPTPILINNFLANLILRVSIGLRLNHIDFLVGSQWIFQSPPQDAHQNQWCPDNGQPGAIRNEQQPYRRYKNCYTQNKGPYARIGQMDMRSLLRFPNFSMINSSGCVLLLRCEISTVKRTVHKLRFPHENRIFSVNYPALSIAQLTPFDQILLSR